MMKFSGQRFTINTPQVVHDTFDNEAVIINLESGNYYSLQHSAEYLWNRLVSGLNVADIMENLMVIYPQEQETIQTQVEMFIGQLLNEKLLRLRAANDTGKVENHSSENHLNTDRWKKPELNRYTDMQELLLLDPIHEVDDLGWPARIEEETDG